MMTQGYKATLVAATLVISRSSLYYRKKPRGSRADRTYDEQIVMACGEKLAYGYRRVAWWLQRKKGLPVNRKRVLRVMRERGWLVRSRRLRARRKKEWGRVEAAEPNQIWQSDLTKIWAGPGVGWAYLVSVIDCCTREIVGWNLSHRCRTEDALTAVEQAVLARLPEGSREARLTEFTSPSSKSRKRNGAAPPPLFNWSLLEPLSKGCDSLPNAHSEERHDGYCFDEPAGGPQ
jgi:putative transposase